MTTTITLEAMRRALMEEFLSRSDTLEIEALKAAYSLIGAVIEHDYAKPNG